MNKKYFTEAEVKEGARTRQQRQIEKRREYRQLMASQGFTVREADRLRTKVKEEGYEKKLMQEVAREASEW